MSYTAQEVFLKIKLDAGLAVSLNGFEDLCTGWYVMLVCRKLDKLAAKPARRQGRGILGSDRDVAVYWNGS